MSLKPIGTIIVLSLVVASLLVAGCTSSTTNQTTSTTPTGARDASLEKFIGAFKTQTEANKNYSTKAFEVTWINSISATVEWTAKQNTSSHTVNTIMRFTVFPTSQDATNYLNAMNKSNYSLASNKCTEGSAGGAYQDVTGHAPQICKDYVRREGDLNSFVTYREYHIFQIDNFIVEATLKALD